MKEAVKRLLDYTIKYRKQDLFTFEIEMKQLLEKKDKLSQREWQLRRLIQEAREEIETVEELKNLGNKDNDGDNKR